MMLLLVYYRQRELRHIPEGHYNFHKTLPKL
jgi:hypothetical protein